MDDESMGSLWQRVILVTTHTANIWPIIVFLRLQKHLRNPYAYWPEIIACLIIDFASTFHHLCGDAPLQHLKGYQFCISDAEALTFTDQMWASSVINLFSMYGPDVCDTAFVKVGWAISLGMNASIAFISTSDTIRYSWWAVIYVIFFIGMRLTLLKRAGKLPLYYKYHINMVDLCAGTLFMMFAYAAKGVGDTQFGDKTYYSWGHGIWQSNSLGAGMGLWANSSSMHYSLVFWKRKDKYGRYYADIVDESGYDVNLFDKGDSDDGGLHAPDEEHGIAKRKDDGPSSHGKWHVHDKVPHTNDAYRPMPVNDTEAIELPSMSNDRHTAPPEALLKVLKAEPPAKVTLQQPLLGSGAVVRSQSRYGTSSLTR